MRAMKGRKRNVLLLGLTSFLNDASSEMIAPLLPFLITSLGGGGMAVGLIGGLRESVSSILKVFFGWWSDRAGRRKPFVVTGYLSSAAFKLGLALSVTWPQVAVASSLERVGKGVRTAPRDAIIAESMPLRRGAGFGIHRAMDTTGAILGSLLVLYLFWFRGMDIKALILLASLMAFFSLLPLWWVKEEAAAPKGGSLLLGLRELPPRLKGFVLMASLFALGNFSYMFFLLRAQGAFAERMGQRPSAALSLLLYVVFNISYAALAIPAGTLSDRWGKRRTIISGYLLFALLCLAFPVVKTTFGLGGLFLLYGVVYALLEGNQRAYVADLAPQGLQGTALGVYHTLVGLAALPSSVVAGLLWEVRPLYTFLYGAAMAIAAALGLGLLKEDSDGGTGSAKGDD